MRPASFGRALTIVLGAALVHTDVLLAAEPPSGATEVAAWLAGTFDSKDQAAADRSYESVRLVTVAVPKSRLASGGPVLYQEQAPSEKPDSPFLVRFFRVEDLGDGRVLLRPFEAKDLAAVRGKWRDPSALALFGPNDMREKATCSVFLRKTSGRWDGSTEGTKCISTRSDARYVTSIVQLSPGLLVSQDRGWDDKGQQSWGPKAGGMRFVRRSEDAPPDEGMPARLAGDGGERPGKEPKEKENKEDFASKGIQTPPGGEAAAATAAGATAATPEVVASAQGASGPPSSPSKQIGLSGLSGLSLVGLGQSRSLTVEDLRRMAGSLPATATSRGKTFTGITLAELLRKSGLETEGMAARRVLAPAIVVVSARDGYSAAFAVEEILSGAPGPLLAFESDGKPLGEPDGPFRIIDPASVTRSLWGVVSLELKNLAANPREESPR